MSTQLSAALADCLAQIERGASVDDCLRRYSQLSAELRPGLEAWQTLTSITPAQPSTAAIERGRQAMQSAIATKPSGPFAAVRMAPTWATAAAAVVAAAIMLGGAAGASAALGGPNLAGDALDAVGVTNGDGDGSGGIGQSSASDRGLECANPNAFEGSANSEDKAQNAVDAQEKENCSEGDGGSGNAGDGINNAPDAAENGKDQANDNASDGSGNAEDGSANRSENANPAGPAGAGPEGSPEDAGGPPEDAGGPPEDAGRPLVDPGVPPEDPGAGQGQGQGPGQD